MWAELGSAVLGGLGKSFGSTLGANAANTGMSALNAPGNSRKENRKNFHQDMEQQWEWDVKSANLGRDIDVGAQQEMFDFRINRGKEAGMTDYEMFMGPAGGAGGGTGSATATLGNSGDQIRQAQTAQKIASEEKQKDRITSMAQTAMQTESQQKVAETQAGVNTRGQDIQEAIAQGKLALDRDTYNNINVPQAAQNLKKTEQETKKLINEVATSDKKFQQAMKQLSMGPANLLVELTMRHHGIALNDNSFMAMDKNKREAILAQILALSSSTYTEGKGAAALGSTAAEQSGAGDIIADFLAGFADTGDGIEPATGTPPNLGTSKGRGSNMYKN